MEFVCQNPRCRKPLEIEESLLEVDLDNFKKEGLQDLLYLEETLKELEGSGTSTNNEEDTTTTKTSEKERRKTFKLMTISKLLERASDLCGTDSHSDVPLCKECAQNHLKNLDTQFAEAVKENNSYKTFLQQLDVDKDKLVPEDQLDLEIQKLEEEEALLREKFKKVEEERRLLKRDITHLEEEENKIKDLEERYWQTFNEFQNELQSFQEEFDSVEMKLANAKDQLDKLKVTNVYNDTFHIWHDGHFGTINSFRLGRLPSQPVDWNEINAAWGQATLLLHTIAKKLNFKFSQYRLLPIGSSSKMERISDKSTYELYGSSDISLGRLFWYRRFDFGMVAFLGCLKEIADHAESQDKNFRLPYRIEKDKIGDMSVRIQFNNEETWTKALKYMLTNLKFLLVWMAH